MSILAVALFGSRARGDEDPSSDVDLLLVTAEGPARHSSMGNLSLSFYPLSDLHARARSGNLFLCHVLREGRALYDPQACFPMLLSEFRLRGSYEATIQQAADFAWYMVRFGRRYPDSNLFRRRVAWCVRTILIGRSAEAGTPTFAPRHLAKLGPRLITARLIAQKDANHLHPGALSDLERFLRELSLPDPLPTATEEAFTVRFKETANSVALHFVKRAAFGANADAPYP
jgi:hypothetical protein